MRGKAKVGVRERTVGGSAALSLMNCAYAIIYTMGSHGRTECVEHLCVHHLVVLRRRQPRRLRLRLLLVPSALIHSIHSVRLRALHEAIQQVQRQLFKPAPKKPLATALPLRVISEGALTVHAAPVAVRARRDPVRQVAVAEPAERDVEHVVHAEERAHAPRVLEPPGEVAARAALGRGVDHELVQEVERFVRCLQRAAARGAR